MSKRQVFTYRGTHALRYAWKDTYPETHTYTQEESRVTGTKVKGSRVEKKRMDGGDGEMRRNRCHLGFQNDGKSVFKPINNVRS